jgi:hypothetical protein
VHFCWTVESLRSEHRNKQLQRQVLSALEYGTAVDPEGFPAERGESAAVWSFDDFTLNCQRHCRYT